MSELSKKVEDSIKRIKTFQRDEGYYLAFSGGKDSVVCKALLDMANAKFDGHYRVTSVDPPELVRFVRNEHPDISRDVPVYGARRGPEWEGKPITMWNLIPWKLMPPTRLARYCCEFLKESGGDGRMTITGVRWAESRNRQENQGPVTVMGKKAGRELGDHPDFTLTDRGGGGADQRQYREPPDDRTMLQAQQGNCKPHHRLGGHGRLGLYSCARHTHMLPVR